MKNARHDKTAYVENIAMKVETAVERVDMSTVYRQTKQLCRHTHASVNIVNDKEGNLLTTEETQVKRWVEHFSEVLNRESVTITADPPPIFQAGSLLISLEIYGQMILYPMIGISV